MSSFGYQAIRFRKRGRERVFQQDQATLRRLMVPFGVALAGMLLSKGPALVPGDAFDDYGVIAQPRSLDFTISQGRFTQALLQVAINQIGVSATHVAHRRNGCAHGSHAVSQTAGLCE
jgi:hypothetical protein